MEEEDSVKLALMIQLFLKDSFQRVQRYLKKWEVFQR